jgi:hypothetical protein
MNLPPCNGDYTRMPPPMSRDTAKNWYDPGGAYLILK